MPQTYRVGGRSCYRASDGPTCAQALGQPRTNKVDLQKTPDWFDRIHWVSSPDFKWHFEFEMLQVNGLNRATGLTSNVVISSNKATVFLINSTKPHLSRIHLKHASGEPRINADLRPSSGSAARSHKRPAQTFAITDNTQQIHSCPTEIFR